jgi:DNA-3-methyladenine glycosylase I
VAARSDLITGDDGRPRCGWCGSDALYVAYHDKEWGVPVSRDRKLFEFLILEGAQAGLSWITVLKRREGYRAAFADFEPATVAGFSRARMAALLKNPGIIRNRLKVASAVANARAFLKVQKEFGSFSRYARGFMAEKTPDRGPKRLADLPARSAESDAWSKDMKKRGFSFVGSTILYAHMQATGMVNDHLQGCFRRTQVGKP